MTMLNFAKAPLLLACLLAPLTAPAAEGIQVSDAWVRATVPGQEVAGAYLSLRSETAAKLVKTESPVADSAAIHSMSMKNGVMEMRELTELALPAGKTVKLAPGGFHIMLIDLKKPLKAGETVPLKLTIRQRDNKLSIVEVQAEVRQAR
jgi:copper(I)-binding protein